MNPTSANCQLPSVDRRIVLLGGLSGAFYIGRPAKAQPSLRKITLGEISRSATGWVRVVAEAKGFFKEEGLEIDRIIVQGGPPAIVQQVVGGSLDIGVSNFDLIIRGVEAGAPITMVGASMLKFAFSVVAARDIKSASDLRGKTIAVSSSRDPTALFFNSWLRNNGVDPKEVDVIYIRASPQRLAGLLSGAVAATALGQPFDFIAMEQGFVRLADFGQMASDHGFLGFVVHREWLNKNQDVVRAFLRAQKRATDWLLDSSNRDEAIRMMAAEISQKPPLVGNLYDYYHNDLKPFSPDLSIPDIYIRGILDSMVEQKELKEPVPSPSKYKDLQYLPKS